MLIGIVGKPSSGKSTFLNAACLTEAKTGNYPFTTIEPNLGTSYVKVDCVCTEFNVNDNPKNSICHEGQRYIPIKLLDVAGLVPDAHKGKGMGNKFLSDLARADALIHVIDISGSLSESGDEVDEGTRDPLEDIKFLESEIDYWFFNIIKTKDWDRFVRRVKQEKLAFSDVLYERLAGVKISRNDIKKTISKIKLDYNNIQNWSDDELFDFTHELRKISKPIFVAANKIDKPNGRSMYNKVKEKYDGDIIPCSGLAEFWLRKYNENNIIKYFPGGNDFQIIDENKLKKAELNALKKIKANILDVYSSTGIQKVLNKVSFDILDQIIVYPVADAHNLSDKDGNVLPDAFLVNKGIKLKEFVEKKIHTEIAKNFIYAINVRSNMRISEDYELKNNDIIKIVSAA